MSDGSKETQPGFKHRVRSSRPPADIADLPEPVVDVSQQPIKSLYQYVAELHQDQRAMRMEFSTRQEAARDAIYKLQAAVEGLRASQEQAFQMLREERRKDRWVSMVGVAMLTALLVYVVLRSYRLVGV
jgi:hypothetical protein